MQTNSVYTAPQVNGPGTIAGGFDKYTMAPTAQNLIQDRGKGSVTNTSTYQTLWADGSWSSRPGVSDILAVKEYSQQDTMDMTYDGLNPAK